MNDRLEQEVRLQNIRNFTVQIRHCETDDIVGTGIVVSIDGKIVTCSHVIRDAGVDPQEPGDAEVRIYFPQVSAQNKKERRANIVASLPECAEDMILLQLKDGPSPLDHRQIALLGTAQNSDGHEFRSFGYRRLSYYQGLPAIGTIVGRCECPADKSLQTDPVMLSSQHIDSGMSGAAVLDVEKNLVIGVIDQTWETLGDLTDRDTGFAIDTQVLSFKPFYLDVNPMSLSKQVAFIPKTDIEKQLLLASSKLDISWNNAPGSLPEWVGRDELLSEISADWENSQLSITALIGFGGDGKTSLARQWSKNLLNEGMHTQPDGLFWWSFHERPNVDELFETALEYISSGRIDSRMLRSGYSQVQSIGNMLGRGRYIFIFDGIEVVQYQKGDQFGLLRSESLRNLLRYFATPKHESFCLITSRIPIIDLFQYTTFTQRKVSGMSSSEGRALFYKVGVSGSPEKIDAVVEKWGGSPLALNLLAKDCIYRHAGDISYIHETHYSMSEESIYKKVDSLLQQYEKNLNPVERNLLMRFSAFRTAVAFSAFKKIFLIDFGAEPLIEPIIGLDDLKLNKVLNRLVASSILHFDQRSEHYHMHPLIREYYYSRLIDSNKTDAQLTHNKIKDYYLAISESIETPSNIKELSPYIEAVHHACRAGEYDEADAILSKHIYREDGEIGNYLLTNQLGAFDTCLELMKEFFPNGDTSMQPMFSTRYAQRWVLHELGFSLMNLGRLNETLNFYKRSKEIALSGPFPDYYNACLTSHNIAELHAYLGEILASESVAKETLSVAIQRNNEYHQMQAMAHIAWAAYLQGDLKKAGDYFKASEIAGGIAIKELTHIANRGIYYADYLLQIKELDRAYKVTETNLAFLKYQQRVPQISQCYRILGDLYSARREHDRARNYYNQSLRIAREVTYRAALIEALLSRGRWMAKYLNDKNTAFDDLNEALEYATNGGFRIYEADIRVAYSWLFLALKSIDSALAEAERAKQMSVEMHYKWGRIGAEEVLSKILDKK